VAAIRAAHAAFNHDRPQEGQERPDGGTDDAKVTLGSVAEIRGAFIDIQSHLFRLESGRSAFPSCVKDRAQRFFDCLSCSLRLHTQMSMWRMLLAAGYGKKRVKALSAATFLTSQKLPCNCYLAFCCTCQVARSAGPEYRLYRRGRRTMYRKITRIDLWNSDGHSSNRAFPRKPITASVRHGSASSG
jgi:hypothetical protein